MPTISSNPPTDFPEHSRPVLNQTNVEINTNLTNILIENTTRNIFKQWADENKELVESSPRLNQIVNKNHEFEDFDKGFFHRINSSFFFK